MTRPLSAEETEARLRAVREGDAAGLTRVQIAQRLGIDRPGTLNQWLAQKGYKYQRDPAIQNAMDAVKTGLQPALAWLKTSPDADGNSYSVMLKPPEMTGPDFAEQIKEALADLPAIPAIAAPEYADEDLLTIYPLADVHFGLMAWGKETGADYDTKTAAERVTAWVGRCIAASPSSGTAIMLDVGDLQHANDQTNQTPQSKHQLDTDTRNFKTTQTAIATLATSAGMLAAHHARVIVRILPGNHNRDAYLAILFALAQRFRDNPRIEVQEVPGEFFAHEHGEVMIAAHHGDKAKADRMVFFMADEYAPMWGRTRHRFLFTGHLHHHKSADIGGVQWEQLRAVTERDAYAVGHAYTSRAQLQAITFHRTRGEVQRVKVNA